jgi:tetratricopeptide (TPR) repeat protein
MSAIRQPVRISFAHVVVRTVLISTLMTTGLCWLSGCTGHRLCDQADDYLHDGRLAEASDSFARAEKADEGSCAAEGLKKVSQLRAQALTDVARGHVAEEAGDRESARSAYQTALDIDRGNGDALAGIGRVTARPTTLNKVWFRAQRLYDEGYVEEARAEVAAVLRAHPELIVPESLAPLSKLPSPTPAAVAPSSQPRPVGSGLAAPSVWRWLTISTMALAVLGIVAGVIAGLRTKRVAGETQRRLQDLETEVSAANDAVRDLQADLAGVAKSFAPLRRQFDAQLTTAVGGPSVYGVDTKLSKLATTVDHQRSVQQLLVRAALASRPGPDVIVDRFQARDHAEDAQDPGCPDTVVCITVAWLANTETSAGQLAIVRSIESEDADDDGSNESAQGETFLEAWVADGLQQPIAAMTGTWVPTPSWSDLLYGHQVGTIDGVTPLRETNSETRDRILEDLSASPQTGNSRTLLEIRADVQRGTDLDCLISTIVERPSGDLFAAVVSPSLHRALGDLEHQETSLDQGEQSKGAPSERRAEALATQVRIKDSRAVQIGNHNLQLNTFVVETPAEDFNFEKALQPSGVADALSKLQENPHDERLRDIFVSRLGARVSWSPRQVTVPRDKPKLTDFLSRLISFDVKGVQIGDNNRQRNVLTYAGSPRSSDASLLLNDKAMARDYADYVCPRPGSGRSAAKLMRTMEKAIETWDVIWADGRRHGIKVAPEPGSMVCIERVDGGIIGKGSRQLNEVRVRPVHLQPPPIPKIEPTIRRTDTPDRGLNWSEFLNPNPTPYDPGRSRSTRRCDVSIEREGPSAPGISFGGL